MEKLRASPYSAGTARLDFLGQPYSLGLLSMEKLVLVLIRRALLMKEVILFLLGGRCLATPA